MKNILKDYTTVLQAEHIKIKGKLIYPSGIIAGFLPAVSLFIVMFADVYKPQGKGIPYNLYFDTLIDDLAPFF